MLTLASDCIKKKDIPNGGAEPLLRDTQKFGRLLQAMVDDLLHRKPGPVSMFNISSGTQIGKLKFMRQLGLSIHEVVAYAIGRRWVRGIEEQVPNSLAHLIPQKTRRVTAGGVPV